MTAGRILFITLSNIGDAVMTTPVLQALHAKYPRAIIDIVADRRSSEMFLHCPYRGEIFYKEKQKFLRGGLALIKRLRVTKYDLIVDLRTDGLAWLLRAGARLTKWNRKNCGTGTHAVEQHMAVIASLHSVADIPDCHVWTGDNAEHYAREVLKDYTGKRLLGLGPGANFPGKIWPHTSYLALIEKLRNKFDAVVLLGDRRDRELSKYISAQSALPCRDLCGETSLLQAAAVLRHMMLFMGNDSGLGHLASAVSTATITLFGIGQPLRYRPWGSKAAWLAGDNRCIENITVQDVVTCMRDHAQTSYAGVD